MPDRRSTSLTPLSSYLLRPGETQRLQRRSHPEVTAIGVLAGYRQLEGSNWRAIHLLPEAPDTSWMRAVMPRDKARIPGTLQG